MKYLSEFVIGPIRYRLLLLFVFFSAQLVAVEPGTAFLVGGPSGAGKTTLTNMVLQDSVLKHSLSPYALYTTRPMRNGEVNGSDYHFISTEQFNELLKQERIFYSVTYDKYQYGYSVELLEDLVNGKSSIFIIGISDAVKALQERLPNCVLIWVDVSDMETLKKRLEARYQNNPEMVKRRCHNAVIERERERKENIFHYHIFNDDGQCDNAFSELSRIIHSFIL